MSQHFWMMRCADYIINFVFDFFIFIYIFFKIGKKSDYFFQNFKNQIFILNFKKIQKSETNSDFFFQNIKKTEN